MIQAYKYGGKIYLKFGKKTSPGVLYSSRDLCAGLRPSVELWRDGTVTFHDRPEGIVSQLKRVALPKWAGDCSTRRFKARS